MSGHYLDRWGERVRCLEEWGRGLCLIHIWSSDFMIQLSTFQQFLWLCFFLMRGYGSPPVSKSTVCALCVSHPRKTWPWGVLLGPSCRTASPCGGSQRAGPAGTLQWKAATRSSVLLQYCGRTTRHTRMWETHRCPPPPPPCQWRLLSLEGR